MRPSFSLAVLGLSPSSCAEGEARRLESDYDYGEYIHAHACSGGLGFGFGFRSHERGGTARRTQGEGCDGREQIT